MLFAFIIVIVTAANYFTFIGLKNEDLTIFEPLVLFQPLFVILLAFIFYSSERNVSEFIPSNPSDQRAHLNSINIQGGSQVININQLARNQRSSRRNNSRN